MSIVSSVGEDPTKAIAVLPVIVGAAKSFTIVNKSEMGVCTRSGDPMLKPDIQERIFCQIWQDLILSGSEHTQVWQLPNLERKERIDEKIDELPEEVTEQGIYKIVGRGVVLLVPFIDRVVKINVANQTSALKPFELESRDDVLTNIAAGITWRVRRSADNPYKALFEINNEKEGKLKTKTQELEQTLSWIAVDGLGRVLADKSFDELKKFDSKDITAKMREECDKDFSRFGAELDNVWREPPTRTAAERLAQAIEKSNLDPMSSALIASELVSGEGGSLHKLRAVASSMPEDDPEAA